MLNVRSDSNLIQEPLVLERGSPGPGGRCASRRTDNGCYHRSGTRAHWIGHESKHRAVLIRNRGGARSCSGPEAMEALNLKPASEDVVPIGSRIRLQISPTLRAIGLVEQGRLQTCRPAGARVRARQDLSCNDRAFSASPLRVASAANRGSRSVRAPACGTTTSLEVAPVRARSHSTHE